MKNKTQTKGITLVELLLVMIIIAAIVSVAYPYYSNHVIKVKKTDAQSMLMQIMQQQRRYFSEHNLYAIDLEAQLGYPVDEQGGVKTEQGYYTITADECGNTSIVRCVQLTATPTFETDQGAIIYNSRNEKINW